MLSTWHAYGFCSMTIDRPLYVVIIKRIITIVILVKTSTPKLSIVAKPRNLVELQASPSNQTPVGPAI